MLVQGAAGIGQPMITAALTLGNFPRSRCLRASTGCAACNHVRSRVASSPSPLPPLQSSKQRYIPVNLRYINEARTSSAAPLLFFGPARAP